MNLVCAVLDFADSCAVRGLKGIGILDAAPVYEPLSGFVRYDCDPVEVWTSLVADWVDLRGISAVALILHVAGTLRGRRRIRMSVPFFFRKVC